MGVNDSMSSINSTSGKEELNGTIEYMAPELFLSQNGYNYSIDWYSLGLVIYEMTSGGTHPFKLGPCPENETYSIYDIIESIK